MEIGQGHLRDKVALITGGGTGIGRAIVGALVAEGARVFITGRRTQPLQDVAAEHGDRVAWLAADIGRPDDAPRLTAAVLRAFGHLDILVNNATSGAFGPLAALDDAAIDTALSIDIAGPLRLIRESLEPLGRRKGQIINIGSTLTNLALPGMTLHTALKAAMAQATRVLAVELGRQGVRVNTVAPGPTETEQFLSTIPQEQLQVLRQHAPFGRLGTPHDIAQAVLLFARDEAAWITGQVIDASGGLQL